ncbi:hypothetical protein ONS95_010482 [Cadophora gregata]|uniref:uncharacterized protein n=1 Tax=Cadophora gregata TaxID=51156 RepID=UPI0026DB3B58|nr:uncharacterized protein ONS95_010482 [Cadophora gregata]KAK0122229.1 hypothetical protein ONS95_010482 [Cadophora gregata]KAK0127705.1 hypothetical protein ONS96_007223 [Cadophora gregata f. sp. sojae]
MDDQPSQTTKIARRSTISSLPDASSTTPEACTEASSEVVENVSVAYESQETIPSHPVTYSVPSAEAPSLESTQGLPFTSAGHFHPVDLSATLASDDYISGDKTVNSEGRFTSSNQRESETGTPIDQSCSIHPETGNPSSALSQPTKNSSVGFQSHCFDTKAQIMSPDPKAADPIPAGNLTQSHSKSTFARNPAQPAAANNNRQLIPLPRKHENHKMFTAGYNHRIFIEATKIMPDEALDEFFDFEGYTDERNGNTEMVGVIQESAVRSDLQFDGHEVPRDSTEPDGGNGVKKDVDDSGGNVSAAQTERVVNFEASTEDTVMADDDKEDDLTAALPEVDSPTSHHNQTSSEQGKEESDIIDADNEMECLDEVDQL